jgi:FixJ family two-component response regulator
VLESRPNRDDRPLVFVVDDDPAVRKSLTRLFKAAGLSVESFDSARAFLDRPLHEGPSCAVLDQSLPGLTGIELQKRLSDGDPSTAVVFLTAHGDVALSVEAMKKGAVDFLAKPIEGERLLDAVRAGLERSAAAVEKQRERESFLARVARLTPREREVAGHVAQGLLNKQIAAELGTSEKTIKAHRGRVMEKLAVRSVAELVRLAERNDILWSAAPAPSPPASTSATKRTSMGRSR